MGLHKLSVVHDGQSHTLDYDSGDGEEVLKVQLFSITSILPEHQDFSNLAEVGHGHNPLRFVEAQDGMFSLVNSGGNRGAESGVQAVVATPISVQSDGNSARGRQSQERSLGSQHERAAFEAKLESYVQKVWQYEDVGRQNAARASVSLDELEEKALVSLMREGKGNASESEREFATLVQLLLWFKKSFQWVNEPDCDICGSKSTGIGMGIPNTEDLRHGASRVEIFECTGCGRNLRFARYNDPMKLLETRAGRCGEWANCFTLYCRAFGYQARLALDFTDHVWTECFSAFHNRWVHFDPCEGVYDTPLLYESGWKKKLSYVISIASDGVYDVTRRYTRDWSGVLTRRTEAAEDVVQEVVSALTARARLSRPIEELEKLQVRDEQEARELAAEEVSTSPSPLPGRQSGSHQWRTQRGELGNHSPSVTAIPIRACVDDHVTEIFSALGPLLKSTEPQRVITRWIEVLQKLQSQPYKTRQEVLQTEDCLNEECSSALLQALGLQRDVQSSTGRVSIRLEGNPIKTALALPVAIGQLQNLNQELSSNGKPDEHQRLYPGLFLGSFLQWRRLSGGTTCASSENLPYEVSSAAFDGLRTTKWLDPKGASGGWIEYRLPECKPTILVGYEVTSANDAPERDPMAWLVEGSDDDGRSWKTLDVREGERFEGRHVRRCFEIDVAKRVECGVVRFRCLATREATNVQTLLQIANLDYFGAKSE